MDLLRENKRTLIILALILMIAIVSTAIWLYRKNTAINPDTLSVFSNQEGEAPYSDLYGKPIALNEYLGNPLVVVSWASWSPFSEGDMRALSELASEFPQAVFMAINRKETTDQAQRYMNSIGDISGVVIALDPRDHFYTAIGGYAMPEIVVYDAQGKIVMHEQGVTNKANIKAALQTLTTN